jgi:spore germination protein GerM
MTRHILATFLVLILIAIGLGAYAWYLQKRVARDAERAHQQQEIAPPGNGAETPVELYIASDEDGSLHKNQLTVVLPLERSERARAVLRALFGTYLQSPSPHPIGPGSDVRDVYVLDDGTAVVDTNAAFANSHPSGVLAEELTVASMVVTLNANDNRIQRVKILVDGKERETLAGHADLRRFYLAGNLNQVAKELQ